MRVANQPTDIAAVLADPTRFAIYERLASNRPKSFTVQEIAQGFSLHPNVARTHLGRLEEIGLVQSVLEKSGRGGRPGKRYAASDDAVTLQFPRRDFLLLSRMLIETVERLGPDAVQKAKEISYQTGCLLAEQADGRPGRNGAAHGVPAGEGVPPVPNGWLRQVGDVARTMAAVCGAQELWQRRDGLLGLRFATCPFREAATEHVDTVCALHQAFVLGALETALGPVELQPQANSLASAPGTRSICEYVVTPAGRRA